MDSLWYKIYSKRRLCGCYPNGDRYLLIRPLSEKEAKRRKEKEEKIGE